MQEKEAKPEVYNRLSEIYLTDLNNCGATVAIKRRPGLHFYHSAEIFYEGHLIHATVRILLGGNVKICSLSGNASGILLNKIRDMKREQGIYPLMRELIKYLYYVSLPCLFLLFLYCFFLPNYQIMWMILLFSVCMRGLFVYSRNHF